MRVPLFVAGMAAMLSITPSAFGCSRSEPPPPAEAWVSGADAIYLAVANRYTANQDAKHGSQIEFTVLETLKGQARDRLVVSGELVSTDDFNDSGMVPPRWVRSDGRRGSCYAEHYKQGGTFLLLIRKGQPYWEGPSPTNEQVTGPQDPWVARVRETLRQPAKPH